MAVDVDLFESMLGPEGLPPEETASPPPMTEVGTVESLLMTIVELLQANNWYSAKQKGRPKIQSPLRPKGARTLWIEKKDAEDKEALLSVITENPW